MITVYYDGKCGLCSKEIEHYRRSADEGRFIWQDITESVEGLEECNVSLAQGLKLLHAKDHEGRMYTGVDAFILIWSNMHYWKILAKITSLPIFYQATSTLYRIFAEWRFKRLEHCKLAERMETL